MKISSTSTRLKEIMNERNLRQVDILRLSIPHQKELNINLGKSTLSQYVTGKQSPDQDRYYLLGKTLDVSEAWLMGYDASKNRISDSDQFKNLYNTVDNKIITDLLTDSKEEYIEVIRKVALLPQNQLSAINDLLDSFCLEKRD